MTDPKLRDVIINAAREFNAGRYFEAHEVLEEGLDEVPDELWDLFLGLIQVAVGYHKVTQDLRSGAVRMLDLGLSKLDAFTADAAGVDVGALRRRAHADRDALRDRSFDSASFVQQPPRLQPLRRRPSRG